MSAKNNDRFINPYNFVPFGQRSADADHAPSGHGSYGGSDLISGTISCVLRVETPLLVLDQDAAVDGEPIPVQVGPDSKPLILPLILPSSVRGMLRGAYEAVTSSRLPVPVPGPFSIREGTDRAREKFPAVVLPDSDKILKVWVAKFGDVPALVKVSKAQVRDDMLGKLLFAFLKPGARNGTPWRVIEWSLNPTQGAAPEPPEGGVLARGFLLSNPNDFPGKRSHIFVPYAVGSGARAQLPLDPQLFAIDESFKAKWCELERRMKETHPGIDFSLKPGRTMLVTLSGQGGDAGIADVSLAQIGRRSTALEPIDLLPSSMTPATTIEEFSPADRVFGLVGLEEGSPLTYRASARVGMIRPVNTSIASDPIRLAPLEAPKPQQYGFYVRAGHPNGRGASGKGTTENPWATGGRNGDELRGRKTYLHHPGFKGPVDSESEAQSSKVRARCVKPDSEFHFDLRVDALDEADLMPLLALLALPTGHFHRLGHGKPLGYGSVRLEIDWSRTVLQSGEELRQEYRNGPRAEGAGQYEAKVAEWLERHAGQSESWKAWMLSAKGFAETEVMYPPPQSSAVETGRSYEWFVKNSKRGASGFKLPVLDPEIDPTLPKRI